MSSGLLVGRTKASFDQDTRLLFETAEIFNKRTVRLFIEYLSCVDAFLRIA